MAGDRSLTPQEQVASNVLAYGKALVPDRFPRPDPLALQAWAMVLGEMRVPPQVWPEAIAWWSMNAVGDRMATPRELKEAAEHIVRDVWETDPVKRRVLDEHRAARLRAREARGELPPGTAPETPGDGPLALNPGRSEEGESAYKRFRAELAARSRARRVAERQQRSPAEGPEEGA